MSVNVSISTLQQMMVGTEDDPEDRKGRQCSDKLYLERPGQAWKGEMRKERFSPVGKEWGCCSLSKRHLEIAF